MLTEEQIKKLNDISILSADEQKKVLPEFLQSLSPEQKEWLAKQQQGGECIFCSIAEGKVPCKKVYEDDDILGILDINPANKGHVLVFPKKHYSVLGQIEDVGKLFNVANKISAAVFEAVKAEGTNIFVANGAVAGQKVPHAVIHVIPRFSGDKVSFSWDGTQVDEKELDALVEQLKGKISFEKEEIIEEPKETSFEELPKEEPRVP